MPTYTYHCDNCGVTFEKAQKFEDKPITRCPECRKGKVRRVMTAPAIVFKGSGWYKTDSRTSSSSTSSKGDKKSDKSEAGDAKPDVKETKETKGPKESKDTKEAAPAAKAETSKKTETPAANRP